MRKSVILLSFLGLAGFIPQYYSHDYSHEGQRKQEMLAVKDVSEVDKKMSEVEKRVSEVEKSILLLAEYQKRLEERQRELEAEIRRLEELQRRLVERQRELEEKLQQSIKGKGR